ncbi:hypothetical protein IE53DRAFT_214349 [Violaceomyces palustris]|uniref:Uncharacterized protein n=1 Tax=Violaceomyces palustris TaxID=1673888 RepID=A0ACD0NQK5_9BASI|nr:hypothetical protein IE53DRAFT_214349 [Violaceomyces palustris]
MLASSRGNRDQPKERHRPASLIISSILKLAFAPTSPSAGPISKSSETGVQDETADDPRYINDIYDERASLFFNTPATAPCTRSPHDPRFPCPAPLPIPEKKSNSISPPCDTEGISVSLKQTHSETSSPRSQHFGLYRAAPGCSSDFSNAMAFGLQGLNGRNNEATVRSGKMVSPTGSQRFRVSRRRLSGWRRSISGSETLASRQPPESEQEVARLCQQEQKLGQEQGKEGETPGSPKTPDDGSSRRPSSSSFASTLAFWRTKASSPGAGCQGSWDPAKRSEGRKTPSPRLAAFSIFGGGNGRGSHEIERKSGRTRRSSVQGLGIRVNQPSPRERSSQGSFAAGLEAIQVQIRAKNITRRVERVENSEPCIPLRGASLPNREEEEERIENSGVHSTGLAAPITEGNGHHGEAKISAPLDLSLSFDSACSSKVASPRKAKLELDLKDLEFSSQQAQDTIKSSLTSPRTPMGLCDPSGPFIASNPPLATTSPECAGGFFEGVGNSPIIGSFGTHHERQNSVALGSPGGKSLSGPSSPAHVSLRRIMALTNTALEGDCQEDLSIHGEELVKRLDDPFSAARTFPFASTIHIHSETQSPPRGEVWDSVTFGHAIERTPTESTQSEGGTPVLDSDTADDAVNALWHQREMLSILRSPLEEDKGSTESGLTIVPDKGAHSRLEVRTPKRSCTSGWEESSSSPSRPWGSAKRARELEVKDVRNTDSEVKLEPKHHGSLSPVQFSSSFTCLKTHSPHPQLARAKFGLQRANTAPHGKRQAIDPLTVRRENWWLNEASIVTMAEKIEGQYKRGNRHPKGRPRSSGSTQSQAVKFPHQGSPKPLPVKRIPCTAPSSPLRLLPNHPSRQAYGRVQEASPPTSPCSLKSRDTPASPGLILERTANRGGEEPQASLRDGYKRSLDDSPNLFHEPDSGKSPPQTQQSAQIAASGNQFHALRAEPSQNMFSTKPLDEAGEGQEIGVRMVRTCVAEHKRIPSNVESGARSRQCSIATFPSSNSSIAGFNSEPLIPVKLDGDEEAEEKDIADMTITAFVSSP